MHGPVRAALVRQHGLVGLAAQGEELDVMWGPAGADTAAQSPGGSSSLTRQAQAAVIRANKCPTCSFVHACATTHAKATHVCHPLCSQLLHHVVCFHVVLTLTRT